MEVEQGCPHGRALLASLLRNGPNQNAPRLNPRHMNRLTKWNPLMNSDIFFQPVNLHPEGRPGQMKKFGCTPEIEFFGNSDKVPRVTEFDRKE